MQISTIYKRLHVGTLLELLNVTMLQCYNVTKCVNVFQGKKV